MMDFISVPLIVGIVFLGVYKLFELFVCKSERIKIIEKLSSQLESVDVAGKLTLPHYQLSQFSFHQSRFSFGALKGGCLMVGIGMGLLFGFFVSINTFPDYLTNSSWEYRQIAGIIYGASVLFFGGLALLLAFIIEMSMTKKKEKQEKEGDEA